MQEVAGLEVFRLGLNVAMNRELQPLGATGYRLRAGTAAPLAAIDTEPRQLLRTWAQGP